MKTKETRSLADILHGMEELPEFLGVPLNSARVVGNFGNTPLHIAAIQGDLQAGEILLAAGVEPDVKGESGYTSLHDAAEQGHADFVSLLLRHGANAFLNNDDGDTAWAIASENGSSKLLAVFENAGREKI